MGAYAIEFLFVAGPIVDQTLMEPLTLLNCRMIADHMVFLLF